MTKQRRTSIELRVEMIEQIHELRASVINYDAGATWEAKRIASSIYKICMDGKGRTRSMLSQLKIRDDLEFVSTTITGLSEEIPVGLLMMNVTQKKFIPISIRGGFHKGDGLPPWRKWLPFEEWWRQIVFLSPNGQSLSRKKLVMGIRSQDGGAHYDEYLRKDAYFDLVNYDGRELQKRIEGVFSSGQHDEVRKALLNVTKFTDARNASIRQIAFEVLFSLREAQKKGLLKLKRPTLE